MALAVSLGTIPHLFGAPETARQVPYLAVGALLSLVAKNLQSSYRVSALSIRQSVLTLIPFIGLPSQSILDLIS